MRQFYLLFENWPALRTVSWTTIRSVSSIKNENEHKDIGELEIYATSYELIS